MWVPDTQVSLKDPAGTAVAILANGASVDASNGGALPRLKLLPYGILKGRDGTGNWRLEGREHAARVIATTLVFQGTADLTFDFDNQTVFKPKRTGGVAGSIPPGALVAGDDGIYASINWTMVGVDAIKGREYRFFSTQVRAEKANGMVTRIIGAGLTNSPNVDSPALASQQHAVHPAALQNLTDEERAACSAVGWDEAEFMAAKRRDHVASSAAPASTDVQRIAAMFGMSEAEMRAGMAQGR